MTPNPIVRKLTFSGSTEVGKLLMEQCAGTVKKLSLELGGNAPFIAFDDADIEMAVKGAIASKYRNAGQTCVCANRILVQDGVYDAFTKRLAETAGAMKVADGFEPGAMIGPLILSLLDDRHPMFDIVEPRQGDASPRQLTHTIIALSSLPACSGTNNQTPVAMAIIKAGMHRKASANDPVDCCRATVTNGHSTKPTR